MAAKRTTIDDYNIKKFQDEHKDNTQAINSIRAIIDHPDQFGDKFCKAAKTQVDVRDCLKEIQRELLETDKEAKEHVKSLVREVNREDLIFFGKKIGWAVWTFLVIFVTAAAQAIFKLIFSGH